MPKLLLPEAAQVQGGSEFPRLCLLTTSHSQGLLKAGFDPGRVRDGLIQQQGALELTSHWASRLAPILLWQTRLPGTTSGCQTITT
jgi:hypothetical protein